MKNFLLHLLKKNLIFQYITKNNPNLKTQMELQLQIKNE
jgi:hypothetical protein